MAIVKSNLLKQLSKNYPNFLKKDLEKFTDIILNEIKRSLKRGERVELRGFGVFSGKIHTMALNLCVMDFSFIGGSMGSVVGEKISRAITLSQTKKIPLVIICSSGGARMQEGAISLMQLAKICSKLSEFSSKTNLLITVLTNPTMGGTTASYAMLGDVILAEPNALIGFAGQRVIKQTIGEDLPEGFQRAEFLKEHGFIDDILARDKMKETLFSLINFFSSKEDIKFNEA